MGVVEGERCTRRRGRERGYERAQWGMKMGRGEGVGMEDERFSGHRGRLRERSYER